MNHDLISTMVLARALSVEPIARALCPEPGSSAGQPFARSKNRWRIAAAHAALAAPAKRADAPMRAPTSGANDGFQRLACGEALILTQELPR